MTGTYHNLGESIDLSIKLVFVFLEILIISEMSNQSELKTSIKDRYFVGESLIELKASTQPFNQQYEFSNFIIASCQLFALLV